MNIQLRQVEIELAIRQYVGGRISLAAGQEMNITFTATRNKDVGIIAEIVLEDASAAKSPAPVSVDTGVKGTGHAVEGTVGAAIASTVATPAAAETETAPVAGAADPVTTEKSVPEEVAQAETEAAPVAEAAVADAAAPATNTASLFG